jgi:hypothetical protein
LLFLQVRFGELTDQSINTLRLLRDAFGVTFKIKEEAAANYDDDKKLSKKEADIALGKTVLLSCLGTGYMNMSRRIK